MKLISSILDEFLQACNLVRNGIVERLFPLCYLSCDKYPLLTHKCRLLCYLLNHSGLKVFDSCVYLILDFDKVVGHYLPRRFYTFCALLKVFFCFLLKFGHTVVEILDS